MPELRNKIHTSKSYLVRLYFSLPLYRTYIEYDTSHGDSRACISRAYYAMYYGTQALLDAKKIAYRTHIYTTL